MNWKLLVSAFALGTVVGCGSSDDPAVSGNPQQDGGGSGGAITTDAATSDAAGGATADAAPVTCAEDAECASLLSEFTPSPAGCAEAYCQKATGTCRLRPLDQDADGYRDANCDVPGFSGFTQGNDCDDAAAEYYPGNSRSCSEKPDGTAIVWPTGTPIGACKYGTQTCGTDGKSGLCGGAIAPAGADTCAVAGSDENCNGTANEECGCGIVGQEEACGPCTDGKRVCLAAGTWGECTGAQVIGQPCGSCGGVVECGGGCSVATPTNHGQSCNSCGGSIQCDGSCSPTAPSTYGESCNSCGGTVTCSGSCSTSQPPNLGASCNSCGGTVTCSGTCSTSQPGNFGASCNSCGGTVTCGGTCSTSQPGNLGTACNSCGGTVTCSGACSTTQPGNYGQSCNACGSGVVQCSGACSSAAPGQLNTGCGSCGGVWQCQTPGSNALTCSKATPGNLGQVTLYDSYSEGFSCCWVKYDKDFGGTCNAGYVFDHAEIQKISGGGKCFLNATTGGGSNCTANAHFENVGTDGANCTVKIYQKRVCD